MAAAQAFDSAPVEWDVSLVSEPPGDADVVVAVGTTLPGALVMDPADPPAVVEQIRNGASAPSVIAVVGASGGCGVTSIVVHLAAAIARTQRVNVVDLHPGGGVALRLGLSSDEASAADGQVLLPVAGGFRLAADPDATSAPERCLAAAADNVDKVIVDLPVEKIAATTSLHRVLLVMTPTVPSATRAAVLMQRHPELVWIPITNRTGPGSETTRVDIERILGRRLALELPCSPGLRDAEDDQKLLTSPLSPWRARVQRLGEAL